MDEWRSREAPVGIRIVAPTEVEPVLRAPELFDGPPRADWTADVLARPGHHLLLALDRTAGDDPVGMIVGVEVAMPDKGVEMFLYELFVAERVRRRGIGRALCEALADRARAAGCYGMWVLTDHDNEAAQRTYRSSGAGDDEGTLLLAWTF